MIARLRPSGKRPPERDACADTASPAGQRSGVVDTEAPGDLLTEHGASRAEQRTNLVQQGAGQIDAPFAPGAPSQKELERRRLHERLDLFPERFQQRLACLAVPEHQGPRRGMTGRRTERRSAGCVPQMPVRPLAASIRALPPCAGRAVARTRSLFGSRRSRARSGTGRHPRFRLHRAHRPRVGEYERVDAASTSDDSSV